MGSTMNCSIKSSGKKWNITILRKNNFLFCFVFTEYVDDFFPIWSLERYTIEFSSKRVSGWRNFWTAIKKYVSKNIEKAKIVTFRLFGRKKKIIKNSNKRLSVHINIVQISCWQTSQTECFFCKNSIFKNEKDEWTHPKMKLAKTKPVQNIPILIEWTNATVIVFHLKTSNIPRTRTKHSF